MNNIACSVLEVLDRFMWMQFCYQFESLLISSHDFISLSIYLHQTALKISRHFCQYNPLSLDNEWKHSTLWCKHATLTYSSLAYWGCDFSYVFVFLCYLFFYEFLQMVVRHLFSFDVSVKDWIILNNSRCFFHTTHHGNEYRQNTEDLGLLLMLHPQRPAKMCEVYSHFEIHSPLKLYMGCQ